MKPAAVRFHHVRDHSWRTIWCPKCLRDVPRFHEHVARKWMLAMGDPRKPKPRITEATHG